MFGDDSEILTGDNAIVIGSYEGESPFETYRAVQFAPQQHHLESYSDSALSLLSGFSTQSSYNLSKPLLKTVSSSSSQHKCPEKPFFVSTFSSFYTEESNFDLIQERVEQYLKGLKDHDWTFVQAESMWQVKYFQGSCLREINIQCFWDSLMEDHLIEVKKVRCEGFPKESCCGFFSNLKNSVSRLHQEPEQQQQFVPSSSSTKRTNLREPLPFPVTMKTGLGNGSYVPPVVITEEQFIGGLRPISSMAVCPFFETRIEASKMLCDLAGKDLSLLNLPECQEICMNALESLLTDEFEEVRQFAIMAFSLFMQLPSYRSHGITAVKEVESLLLLIRNAEEGEVSSLQSIQLRRKAAEGVVLLAASYPFDIGQLLRSIGFGTLQLWLDHCGSIVDQRLKESALALSQTYFL